MKKELYLCPPNDLYYHYHINPWMDKALTFNKDLAMKQWNELFQCYQEFSDIPIYRIEPKAGLTELCFFGDSLFAIDYQAVFSRMATQERFNETEYAIHELLKKGFVGQRVPEQIQYEGSGETLIWGDTILVGYGQRSSSEIAKILTQRFNKKVVPLELIQSKYYHLDTALFPINSHYIAYFPAAFSENSIRALKALPAELIEFSEEDALNFAPNSISLNNKVIIHYSGKKFIQKLKNLHIETIEVDVSEFIKFGGGLKCLTFQHYLTT